MKMLSRLWADEAGFVVSSELVLIATIAVIGLIAGLTTVRDQVVLELADVADAVSEIDQSYSFSAITGHASSTAGSLFNDSQDFCERAGNDDDQLNEGGTQCVLIVNNAQPE